MNMPPESDDGPTEYKYRLTDLSVKQKQHLAGQMTFRLSEENGQAIYEIGLTDDGFPLGLTERELDDSIESLREIVDIADNAVICAIDNHTVKHHATSERELIDTTLGINRKNGMTKETSVEQKWKYVANCKKKGCEEYTRHLAEVIIRKDIGSYWETKVGIAGNVDCGKSTLLGVLTSGKWDNGRGSARLSVMAHDHEIESGRTSSVTQQIVGFDDNGSLVNEQIARKSHTDGKIEWSEIIKGSSKIVTFFDLAGHLKYLSQTIKGLSSNELDYVLIIVGANMSESVAEDKSKKNKWINMTKEHMELSLVLGMRCIVVITKTDMVNDDVKTKTIGGIKRLIKRKYASYTLESTENVKTCVKLMGSGNVIPIVQVSNVTGEGHDILKKLLNYLPPRRHYDDKYKDPPIMQIQDIFRQVEGTSTVIAGMLTSGEIVAGQAPKGTAIKIGPLNNGTFLDARIRSIHCKRMDVAKVSAGKYVCLGLPKAVDGSQIKKNMFAVGASMKPKATWEFWADIKLNTVESTCIKVGYTPYCYIGHVRQTCKILQMIEIPEDLPLLETKEAEKNLFESFKSKLSCCKDYVPEFSDDNILHLCETQSIEDLWSKMSITDKNNVRDLINNSWDDNYTTIERLAAGDEARVLMRFCFRPELIFDSDKKRLVFKEAKTKGVGLVLKTTDTQHEVISNKSIGKNNKRRLTRKERREKAAQMQIKAAAAIKPKGLLNI